MIKGLVVKNTRTGYFTDLRDVFNVLGDRFKDYNWLFSSYETTNPNDVVPFEKDWVWLDGKTMYKLALDHEMQVIWGVLTAYKKEISQVQVMSHELPWADGNGQIWENPLTFQNPLCEIEIIPWDSSLLVIKSLDAEIINDFKKAYPVSQDLETYNDRMLN